MALRTPQNWLHPAFFAEDGAIFFQQQLVSGWRAVFSIYNGYFHLLPRLAALAASVAPVVDQPLIYGVFSALIQTLAASFFLMPHNRVLVRSDLLRLAVCALTLVDFDGDEALNNVMFAQWFLLPVALQILCHVSDREAPLARGRTFLYCLLLGAIGLTAPLMLIFLPIALFILFFRARGWEKLVPSTMLVAGVIQAVALWQNPVKLPPEPAAPSSAFLIVRPFVATIGAWTYRDVLRPMFGVHGAEFFGSRGGELFALLVFLTVLFGCVQFYRKHPGFQSAWFFSFFVISIALVGTSFVTRQQLLSFFHDLTHYTFFGGGARYFYVSGWLTLVLAAMTIEHLLARWSDAKRVGAMLALFACGALANYPVPDLPDRNWAASARTIDDWKTRRDHHESTPYIRLLINPEPWTVDLPSGNQ